jgi:hypothetical protein
MSVTIDDKPQYITTSAVNEILLLVRQKLEEKQNKLTDEQISAIDSVVSGNFVPYSSLSGPEEDY